MRLDRQELIQLVLERLGPHEAGPPPGADWRTDVELLVDEIIRRAGDPDNALRREFHADCVAMARAAIQSLLEEGHGRASGDPCDVREAAEEAVEGSAWYITTERALQTLRFAKLLDEDVFRGIVEDVHNRDTYGGFSADEVGMYALLARAGLVEEVTACITQILEEEYALQEEGAEPDADPAEDQEDVYTTPCSSCGTDMASYVRGQVEEVVCPNHLCARHYTVVDLGGGYVALVEVRAAE